MLSLYKPFSYAINSAIIWTISAHGCIQVENKFDILENDLWFYFFVVRRRNRY